MRVSLILAASVLSLGGCGDPRNDRAESCREGEIRIRVHTPSIGENLSETRSGGEATDVWHGFPPYPGANPSYQSVGSGWVVEFRTGDPATRVIDFYAEAFPRAGSIIISNAPGRLVARDASCFSLTVTATEVNGATEVQLFHTL